MGTGWLEKTDCGHFTCFQVGSHITQIRATGDARDAGDAAYFPAHVRHIVSNVCLPRLSFSDRGASAPNGLT